MKKLSVLIFAFGMAVAVCSYAVAATLTPTPVIAAPVKPGTVIHKFHHHRKNVPLKPLITPTPAK